jgi:hypothetical protein
MKIREEYRKEGLERKREKKEYYKKRENLEGSISSFSCLFSFLGTIHTDTRHGVCVRVCIVLGLLFRLDTAVPVPVYTRTCGVYAYNESITIRTSSKVVIILRLMHLVTSLNRSNIQRLLTSFGVHYFPMDARVYFYFICIFLCLRR